MGWGRVYGGAEGGSGWKPEFPKPTQPWLCGCRRWYPDKDEPGPPKVNPPYLKNCPDCRERRPY